MGGESKNIKKYRHYNGRVIVIVVSGNSKFTAKQLNRQASKAAKEELQEKAKTKKAMMQGNNDIALLYAQNAIRKSNERVNLLKIGIENRCGCVEGPKER